MLCFWLEVTLVSGKCICGTVSLFYFLLYLSMLTRKKLLTVTSGFLWSNLPTNKKFDLLTYYVPNLLCVWAGLQLRIKISSADGLSLGRSLGLMVEKIWILVFWRMMEALGLSIEEQCLRINFDGGKVAGTLEFTIQKFWISNFFHER